VLTPKIARRRASCAAQAVPGVALAAARADKPQVTKRAVNQVLEVRALAGIKGTGPMNPRDKPYVGPRHRLRYLEEKF
jgi:hypothetical protein